MQTLSDKMNMERLNESIEQARKFIFSKMGNDGLWKDFESRTHGESVDWISSYIGLSLLQSGASASELNLTAGAILERQNKEYGGWGWNEKIVPDADSTAFAIMFLSYFGCDVNRAKDFLLKHQKSDGSFGTYIPDLIRRHYGIPIEKSVDGWCHGISDVTASALHALGNAEDSVKYLIKNQTDEGFWRAYWYNNDIYSTVHAVRALKKHGCQESIEKAQLWLAQQKIVPEVPFYIALSLQGLMASENFSKQVVDGINRLLDLQEEDGSWKSYPILRFPSHSNTEPWKDASRWREEMKDQNGLFTTAACLQALFQCSVKF